jgi:hypothetical protein
MRSPAKPGWRFPNGSSAPSPSTAKRATIDDFFAAREAHFWVPNSERPTARQKARAAAKAIQVRHDRHLARIASGTGLIDTKVAHRAKMSAEAVRSADPATNVASLNAINGPVIHKRRLTSIQAIVSTWPQNMASRQPTAVQVLAQIDHAAMPVEGGMTISDAIEGLQIIARHSDPARHSFRASTTKFGLAARLRR